MFERLGRFVSRMRGAIIACWAVGAIVTIGSAPEWSDVAQEGEFAFLPENVASKVAERTYRTAFPSDAADDSDGEPPIHQDPLGSKVVIVVEREDLPDGLTNQDFQFVEQVLKPGLEAIGAATGPGYATEEDSAAFVVEHVRPDVIKPREQQPGDAEGENVGGSTDVAPADRVVAAIWAFDERIIGAQLISEVRRATLVVVELRTEFLDRANGLLLDRIEAFVDDVVNHRDAYPAQLQIPANLEIAISGSATVGRDMLRAERDSTRNTELYTKILVIVLLLLIYRSPLLVVIPLVTVGLTVELTVALLRHLAAAELIEVFSGLQIYVTVVVYGAGVDFCLFFVSRYKEELDGGATFDEAIAAAMARVGIALATSAGTSIAGIGMMMFAQFGKFPQAGFAISFGLFIVLCCVLTLTPAMLRLSGRWAFWPDVRRERISASEGWIPSAGSWTLLFREQRWTRRIWDGVAALLERRPGTVFLTTVALMTPFAVIAVLNYNRLSYGLLSELRPEETSVAGAKAVQEHFPAGMTGITSVLLQNDHFDFNTSERISSGEEFAEALTDELEPLAADLGLVDIRSQRHPVGTGRGADRAGMTVIERGIIRRGAQRTYVSTRGPLAGQVIRLDLVFDKDPFTADSVSRLDGAEAAVREALEALQQSPPEDVDEEDLHIYRSLPEDTTVLTLGSTASIRDLKSVTDQDRVTIAVLVTIAVYFVLILLLRRPAISFYLIITVVFSFLVTLGATHVAFRIWNGAAYSGVDWKAPIFVFTILVAMGEDYNVLLMSRVLEEQQRHGKLKGVLVALTKTGGIISSCGVIMAGTFSSLMTGTLMGIIQLGFALAFGVLLDTFVVRPILVPSYLVLLYQGRFGRWGRWLGAEPDDDLVSDATEPTSTRHNAP